MARKPNPENMVTVRTTFRPDQEIQMDQREAEDLRRQGLLVEDGKTNQEESPKGEELKVAEADRSAARRAPRDQEKETR